MSIIPKTTLTPTKLELLSGWLPSQPTYRGKPLDGADGALIGTTEHGVLGTRWVYDGTRDPLFAERIVALIQGTAAPQAQSQNDTPDLTVHTRAASPARLGRDDNLEVQLLEERPAGSQSGRLGA